jgi:hypothetical protein
MPAFGRKAPPLFGARDPVERSDFEGDAINHAPQGFEVRSGEWVVVDSPTAASGYQVLVRRGKEAARLVVKGSRSEGGVRGEVAVRLLVGNPGAGIACEGGGAESYMVRAEHETKRAALYRREGESLSLVAAEALPLDQNQWARLGIACGAGGVVAYLNGRPIARVAATLGRVALVLEADPEVVAQFDDLRYATRAASPTARN